MVLFIINVLCNTDLFAEDKQVPDSEATASKIKEAKKEIKAFFQKQTEESQESIRKLIVKKNTAKTNPEKAVFQARIKARTLAQQKTKELYEFLYKMASEGAAAKTDAEKAAFQKKIQNLLIAQQAKLTDLTWQRKLARFKGLYYALLSVSKTKDGKRILPKTLDSISKKTQLDLSDVHYNGSLETGLKNEKETVLLIEKKADLKGRKITLFLDGHVEVTESKKSK